MSALVVAGRGPKKFCPPSKLHHWNYEAPVRSHSAFVVGSSSAPVCLAGLARDHGHLLIRWDRQACWRGEGSSRTAGSMGSTPRLARARPPVVLDL